MSYLISLGVIHITNQKVIHLLAQYGYTIKNGDKSLLYEEIDAPLTHFTGFMFFLPYINIIISLLQGIVNLLAIDDIICALVEDDIIMPFSQQERNYYEENGETFITALTIILRKEQEYEWETIYQLEKENAIQTNHSNLNLYQAQLDKILTSEVELVYKTELLRIFRYCLGHKILNFDVGKLLSSIQNDDKLVVTSYIQLFHLEPYTDEASMICLITTLNGVINCDSLSSSEKKDYLDSIYQLSLKKIRKNGKGAIQICLEGEPDNEEEILISIIEKPKKKRHYIKKRKNI